MLEKIYSVLIKKNKKKRSPLFVKTGADYKEKRKVLLSEYTPWFFYYPMYYHADSETVMEVCIVVQKNGSLQVTFGFRGHDIESFSPSFINNVFMQFNGQIKRLSDGWMIEIEAQRFRMHEYPSAVFDNLCALIVDLEREQDFKSSGEHFDSDYFLTFVYKPENEIKKKINKMFITNPVTELSIKEEINKFYKRVMNICEVMSNNLIIRPLTVSETVNYLASTVSDRKFERRIPKGSFLFLDSFICKSASVDVGNIIRIGDTYYPICEVADFPTATYPAILNDLNKLDIEYRWVTRFIPASKKNALKELERSQQNAAASGKGGGKLAGEMMLGYESTLTNHAGEMALGEAEAAQADIGGDLNSLGYYQSSVCVWDKDITVAYEKLQKVINEIDRHGFESKDSNYNSFDAFLGMLPGNTTGNVRRFPVTSGSMVHTLPLSAVWAGMEHNKHLGGLTGVDKPLVTCSTNYGTNFYLNLNVSDVGHTFILGPTGSGKSTLLNLLAISSKKYPDSQVFFMDYGLSMLTLTLAAGGDYIDSGNSKVSFQPLRDVDTKEEYIWACDYIATLIEIQGIKVNAQMGKAIENAMDSVASAPVNMRTLTQFKLNLEYTDENGHRILDDALHPYTIDGRYGEIFDGEETSLTNDCSWVLFEMQQIMNMGPGCSGPAILFIFHYLEHMFNGRLTFFFMDECWFGLENPVIAQKMKEYLLTLRKKNVFCIFATQNPAQVASSSLASVILQNCPTKIFLADPTAVENIDSYRCFGLTDDEIGILAQSIPKRDYYLKTNSNTRLFDLKLGPIELALFRNTEGGLKVPGTDKIIRWGQYLKFLNSKRTGENKRKAFVDAILDIQQVPFRHLLKDEDNWEEWL